MRPPQGPSRGKPEKASREALAHLDMGLDSTTPSSLLADSSPELAPRSLLAAARPSSPRPRRSRDSVARSTDRHAPEPETRSRCRGAWAAEPCEGGDLTDAEAVSAARERALRRKSRALSAAAAACGPAGTSWRSLCVPSTCAGRDETS